MHPVYNTGVPLLSRERFCIFNQQIYYIIYFLRLAEQSQFIPLQNAVYFIKLPFLVRKIFTFYVIFYYYYYLHNPNLQSTP